LNTGELILILILLSSHLLLAIVASALLIRRAFRDFTRPGFYAALVFLAELSGQLMLIINIGGEGQITPPFTHLLDQGGLMLGFCFYFPLLAYFCEIKRQRWLTFGKSLFFIVPVVVLIVGLIIFPSKGLEFHSFSEIKENISCPNIWIRFALASLYILYGIHCAASPVTNWRQCIVPKSIITVFRILFAVIGIAFIGGLLLGNFFCVVINCACVLFLSILIVYIELYVRIYANAPDLPEEFDNTIVVDNTPHPFFDNPDIWMNPEMNAVELSRLMGTNQKYLTEQIKALGFAGYSDMMNRKRVKYVCDALQSRSNDAHVDIGQLMFDAGFRSRSTASSEFKRIMGCTPSEYLKTLK